MIIRLENKIYEAHQDKHFYLLDFFQAYYSIVIFIDFSQVTVADYEVEGKSHTILAFVIILQCLLRMLVIYFVFLCDSLGWRMLSMNMLRHTTILRSVGSNHIKSSSTRRHIRYTGICKHHSLHVCRIVVTQYVFFSVCYIIKLLCVIKCSKLNNCPLLDLLSKYQTGIR